MHVAMKTEENRKKELLTTLQDIECKEWSAGHQPKESRDRELRQRMALPTKHRSYDENQTDAVQTTLDEYSYEEVRL